MIVAVYKNTRRPVKRGDILTSYRQQTYNFDRVDQQTQRIVLTAGGGVEYDYHVRTFPEIEVFEVGEVRA